jgi:hypothetical protein
VYGVTHYSKLKIVNTVYFVLGGQSYPMVYMPLHVGLFQSLQWRE